jgi:hypothetical protein
MSKHTMTQTLTAVAAAALLAGIVTLVTPTAPQANAAFNATSGKSAGTDNLPARSAGPDCASQTWPHYDAACRFDRRAGSEPRPVRIIAIR